MKVLTPLIGFLCLMVSGLYGQVSVQVSSSDTGTGDAYSITPDQQEIEAWRSEMSPVLTAWPADVEMQLIHDKHTYFEVAGAVNVLLVLNPQVNGEIVASSRESGKLASTRLTAGKRALLEVPAGKFNLVFTSLGGPEAVLDISGMYIESQPQETSRDFGFGTAEDCHPNANCETNDKWDDVIRSTVRIRIVVQQGAGWCSGTLMNNTRRDGAPIILSAEHCVGQYMPLWDLWRFDFNYEGEGCENPDQEPIANSLTGCRLRAKQRDTDFMILELDQEVPVEFNAYFSGWNRKEDYEPPRAALVHHASGDVKKVSRDNTPTRVFNNELNWLEGYTTPPGTHFRNRLDIGSFEGGSSGGGLFDEDGSLIGQLHGGSGDCDFNTIYSGILRESWDYGDTPAERLRDWLDPTHRDSVVILEGMEHPDLANTYQLTGTVKDPFGNVAQGIMVQVEGQVPIEIEADSNGHFALDFLPRNQSITITPTKPQADYTNGVSATDLLLIKKYLLGEQPFEEYQILASDATGDDNLSAGDLLQLQKLLLGLIPYLLTQDAWVFLPASITIEDPSEDMVELEFTAIKVGDVNGTADPRE